MEKVEQTVPLWWCKLLKSVWIVTEVSLMTLSYFKPSLVCFFVF